MQSSSKPILPRRFLGLRSFLGVLAAVMMLFGQSLAVGAVQSSSGVWIEICGGDGTKLVQTGEKVPQGECTHCDYCSVQFTHASFGPAPLFLIGPAPVFWSVQFIAVPAGSKPGAAQYWAANRGPPRTSEENMNTFFAPRAAMITSANGGVS